LNFLDENFTFKILLKMSENFSASMELYQIVTMSVCFGGRVPAVRLDLERPRRHAGVVIIVVVSSGKRQQWSVSHNKFQANFLIASREA
jgi:hypothetical protein